MGSDLSGCALSRFNLFSVQSLFIFTEIFKLIMDYCVFILDVEVQSQTSILI